MTIEKNFIQCLHELKKMLELTEEEKEKLKFICPQIDIFERYDILYKKI